MNNSWKTELLRATAQTFEDLCFQFPDAELDAQQRNAQVDVAVCVAFQGPFNGSLILKLCGGLLPGLATSMLGEGGPPSQAQQHDALGEIANIICGNVLPMIAGAHQVFHLSAPHVVQHDDAVGGDGASPVTEVQLGIEQGRAEVLLFADRAVESTLKESHR
jgi:CheY-specific phosphatase CheX